MKRVLYYTTLTFNESVESVWVISVLNPVLPAFATASGATGKTIDLRTAELLLSDPVPFSKIIEDLFPVFGASVVVLAASILFFE